MTTKKPRLPDPTVTQGAPRLARQAITSASLAKPAMPSERSITVTSTLQTHKTSYGEMRERKVPWIRLRGIWLEQAGFTIGTPVRIRVMSGCLVLTTD
jgi:hypothetical protein